MYLDSDKSKELITKTTGKNDCVYAFFDVFSKKRVSFIDFGYQSKRNGVGKNRS